MAYDSGWDGQRPGALFLLTAVEAHILSQGCSHDNCYGFALLQPHLMLQTGRLAGLFATNNHCHNDSHYHSML